MLAYPIVRNALVPALVVLVQANALAAFFLATVNAF